MEFKPSIYQERILDYVRNNRGNLIIEAKAGSGKTSTLKLLADEIVNKQKKKCLFLAFNKSIADELRTKIGGDSCEVRTLHSLGHTFLRSYCYKKHGNDYELIVDSGKVRQLVRDEFNLNLSTRFCEVNADLPQDELKSLGNDIIDDITKLINFCRFYNTNYKDELSVIRMADRHTNYLEDALRLGVEGYPASVERVIEKIKYDFLNPPQDEFGKYIYTIDYTDMVHFPVCFNIKVPAKIKPFLNYVLVDESQDLNIIQQFLLQNLDEGFTRYIFVGDRKQSIYGFAGADVRSMDHIKHNFDVVEAPLNICYRCPENVIRIAQDLVPEIEWNPAREDKGNVELIYKDDLLRLLQPDDLIIGRKNKDILQLYKELAIDRKMSVKFKNRDLVNIIIKHIEDTIKSYIRKYNRGENIESELYSWMEVRNIPANKKQRSASQQKEVDQKAKELGKKAIEKQKEICKSNHSIPYLEKCMEEYRVDGGYAFDINEDEREYFNIIRSFIKYYTETYNSYDVKSFNAFISKFLAGNMDKRCPAISTIHMMKGGEADNVFILDYPAFPYYFRNYTEDDMQQERNLQYVAITRAKKNLYLMYIDNPLFNDKIAEANMNCQGTISYLLSAKK